MAAPLREPTFWILTVLAAAPHHGYGVIQQTAHLSGDRVRLQAGTLYAALDRLQAEGLVEPDREETVDGRTRRYYRITDHGVAVLEAETARLRTSAEVAAGQLAARRRPGLGPATARVALP